MDEEQVKELIEAIKGVSWNIWDLKMEMTVMTMKIVNAIDSVNSTDAINDELLEVNQNLSSIAVSLEGILAHMPERKEK